MIRDLDETIQQLLTTEAATGSELETATISFDIPDSEWQNALTGLTVNCYLYDVHENTELRSYETLVERAPDNSLIGIRDAPRRINCGYCITAWSTATSDAVLEEHRILGQVLRVLLKNPTIPNSLLQGDLVNQIPPYPTVVASSDGMKNHPDFWGALDQKLKPSLNYIIALSMMLDEPSGLTSEVSEVIVTEDHL